MVKTSPPQISPGTLWLVRGQPNPLGAQDSEMFLFAGDATSAPIREVIPAEGATIPPPLDAAARPFRLSVLHFNDLHGHVSRATPNGERAALARMVWHVKELRRRSHQDPRQGVLFLSGGDDLAGAALGELLIPDPTAGIHAAGIHAAYHLYSAAGVDAAVVGNHDLDRGSRLLAQAIERDARFPLLSANLRASLPLAGQVYPAALLVVKGLRVGLVGLTTTGEARCRDDYCLTHPLTALQNLLPALQPLCDVLIVLSHLGRSLACTTATIRDIGDVELAAALPPGSVHLIAGGHTHEALNESGLSVDNLVNGIPIVQAGIGGRFLGQVDIAVNPGVAVSVRRVGLIPTADLPLDETFQQEQVQPLLDRVRPLLARRLGRVADQPDLTPEAVRDHMADGESALANLIADALVARCRAAGYAVDLAAVDASSICCGLQAGGELTFGDWFNLMPYADTICLRRLSERQLAELLDDNARRVDLPGEPHLERGFMHFSREVRYTIERGPERGSTGASRATLDGLALDRQSERSLLLACTSFVRELAAPWERYAAGRLGLPLLPLPGSFDADTGIFVREALLDHIRAHGGVTEAAGARRDRRLAVVDKQQASIP